MTMTLTVRRSIITYIFYIVWIPLTFYAALNSGLPASRIWGILFIAAIVNLIFIILKPYYMTLAGGRLTIRLDLISSIAVDISDIERIEIKAVPWSSSRILLNGNERHVKFNYYRVRNNDFDALLKELNVPVR